MRRRHTRLFFMSRRFLLALMLTVSGPIPACNLGRFLRMHKQLFFSISHAARQMWSDKERLHPLGGRLWRGPARSLCLLSHLLQMPQFRKRKSVKLVLLSGQDIDAIFCISSR